MSRKSIPPVYLDNAATSWPKPDVVFPAVQLAMSEAGGNPGRGGHQLARAAGNLLFDARETLSAFFGCKNPFRLVFTSGITESVNLALKGFLSPGDHVLISPMEHNAIMRPLNALRTLDIRYTILPSDTDGRVIPTEIAPLIHAKTRLIVLCHESNVNGVIQPLQEIGRTAASHGLFFLVDTAQSAGHVPLDMSADSIDFLTFTGHKGLSGPQGTGGLIFGERVDIESISPLKEGGTGSLSDQMTQPDFMPDKFESGTANLPGIAGLSAAIRWIQERGMLDLSHRQRERMEQLSEGLRHIPRIRLYHALAPENRGSVLSLTIEDMDNGLAGQWLDEEKSIMSRIGLHCAPLAHQTLKTVPNGTIRLAPSSFTTEAEIDRTIAAFRELAKLTL